MAGVHGLGGSAGVCTGFGMAAPMSPWYQPARAGGGWAGIPVPWRRSARGLAALLWICPRPALAASRLVVQDLADGRDDHFGGSVDCLRDPARWVAELAGDLG